LDSWLPWQQSVDGTRSEDRHYRDKKLEEDVPVGGAGSREGRNMGEDDDTKGKPVEAVEMMSNFGNKCLQNWLIEVSECNRKSD